VNSLGEGALAGVRVLELSEGVSAPFCGKLLALYGAEVIKIEPPGGDPARRHGPFSDDVPHPEKSALFLYLNTGKLGVTLDVGKATGARLLRRLVLRADVLVENLPAGRLDPLGLGYEQLASANRRLLIASVSLFGRGGPYADRRGTNLTSFAAGGQMYLTGDPAREPLLSGGYQAEYQAGLNAFSATVAGLLAVAASDAGQHIDVSAVECMAAALEVYLPDYAYRRSEALSKRRGNINSAGIGLYPCQDGYLGIHAMPRQFPALAKTMDLEWMLEDERFRDARSRLRHDDELAAHFYAWCLAQYREEAYEKAGRFRAPLTYVHTLADLMGSPQLRAREFFQEIDHPEAGRLTYPGPPFRMGESAATTGRAPLLGEHNEKVYGERLGLSRHDLVRLRQNGVI
jgi:crotonobetainyl-CoA:carnitine CoA-transferase CaiB-like acyl-CoA transferase